jgi:hypothetical protein
MQDLSSVARVQCNGNAGDEELHLFLREHIVVEATHAVTQVARQTEIQHQVAVRRVRESMQHIDNKGARNGGQNVAFVHD